MLCGCKSTYWLYHKAANYSRPFTIFTDINWYLFLFCRSSSYGRFVVNRKRNQLRLSPFNFVIPFNYSKISTPQGLHHTVQLGMERQKSVTEYSKQWLSKSAFDLKSPYFMPFSAVLTPEKAFSIVSKSAGILKMKYSNIMQLFGKTLKNLLFSTDNSTLFNNLYTF